MPNEGLIIDVDYNITKAEAKQRKLNREFDISKQKAANITKEIQSLNDEIDRSKIKEQEYISEAEKLRNRANKYLKGELQLTDEQVKKERQRREELEKLIDKEQSHQRSVEKSIASQNLALKKQNSQTANIGDQILLNGKKQNKFTKSFEKSSKSADRFGKRLKSLIASALFFSLVTKAFTALRNEFGKLITETGTKTAALVAQLKGNLVVIGRTLYESARPAIETVLQLLVKITNLLATGLSKTLGKNVNEMKKLAKQTKKTGEEAKKATAGFDTLQTIDTSSGSSSAGGNVGTDFSALTGEIDGEVALLMTIVSGALLVLGVILAFTGVNIPLGIGLIIAGAVGLATSVVPNWSSLSSSIQNTILIITAIVSVALLVLGAIFCFTGHIALGVGFLILGAVGLAAAAAVSMNKMPDNVKKTVSTIAAIVGGALLVLGIILLATGVATGLGLGLLVAGASLLAGTLAANWNTLPEKTKEVISAIMGIGGLLMLIIGLILTCTGNLALGIPLIVIGAVGLVSAVALNWNAIVNGIRGPIGKIMAIIGASLLVLGILLLFVPGVGWGLGLGLILAGAAALGTSVAFNWNAITEKVKSIASAIGKVFKNCWDGIKKGFKSMVNGIISFANLWIDGLNFLLFPIRGLIVGISKAFGKDVKLNDIKIPRIPKLATGAILPGGSPMLAWVNDQPKGQPYVEGSIENIAAAFEKYLGGRGLGNQNITIEAKGNWAQFIKWMNLQIKQENNRATIWG